jgi:hypothetical protein
LYDCKDASKSDWKLEEEEEAIGETTVMSRMIRGHAVLGAEICSSRTTSHLVPTTTNHAASIYSQLTGYSIAYPSSTRHGPGQARLNERGFFEGSGTIISI